MIDLLGEPYYIDLDKVEEYLDMEKENTDIDSAIPEIRINLIKFELVKMLLETILTEQEIVDDRLALPNKKETNVSIPFKLAFNTLLNKKLINHY
jgi:hypothetical protein